MATANLITNERDWLTSNDPAAMLDHIRPQASERKLRLFVEACRELDRKKRPSKMFGGWPLDLDKPHYLQAAVTMWSSMALFSEIGIPSHILRQIFGNPFRPVELPNHLGNCCGKYWHTEYCGKCKRQLERPAWLTPQVLSLTQSCYDLRDPGYFPLIWDALEEAGCAEEEIRHALAWEGRCSECLGAGRMAEDSVMESYNDFLEKIDECESCHGTGWLPLPGEQMCPRGHWVIDLILGLN